MTLFLQIKISEETLITRYWTCITGGQ